jgi:hypothetical protein
MAGPQNQNPRGERLTVVLLKQGLVFSPPSLGQLDKTTSIKNKSRLETVVKESVAKARLYHQTLEAGRP